jgi:Zn-dependent protease with chaperone function
MPTYPGISSEAFRHPLDIQAEQTLRSVPGFELVARSFIEYLYERPQQVYLMGNNIQVGPRQYSTISGIFSECYALGHEHPYIVVNTGLLDLMNETELRSVLAHELGHIKCDHTILIQMAIWAMGAASMLGELTLGLGNIISSGLIYAFYEWRRKAELSADRAALLVMDDINPIMHTMMKVAGGSSKYLNECSLPEFINQSEKYQDLDQDSLNQVYKFLIYNGGNGTFISHPFPVERLHFLKDWSNSEEYRQIRRGNYRKAGAEGSVDVESESEVDSLRRQIEELQAEIERIRSNRNR